MDNEKLYSLSAEAAVLGSILVDPDCFCAVQAILPDAENFFKDEHKAIYSALLQIFNSERQGQKIDAVVLRDELEKSGQLEDSGGVEYIAKVMDSVPHAANAEYYARIVRQKQQYRDLITSVERMQDVLDEPVGADEQTQKIQEIALNLEVGSPDKGVFSLRETGSITDTIREHNKVGIKTGFVDIDRIIGGLNAGTLTIIAGRTSMGKSALALNMAVNMAMAGKSVVYFTFEMLKDDVIERIHCGHAKINSSELRDTNCSSETIEKSYEAEKEINHLDITIHETALTPERQRAFLERQKKLKGADVVFVDYLQLMHAGSRAENRTQEVSTISRKLKSIATQLQIPVVALSQLNRNPEARTNHRPRLSDLRESGSLEQDADIVMLIHREDYYRWDKDPNAQKDGTAELSIAKNRRGRTAIVELTFLEEYCLFGNLTRDEELICQNQ